MNLQAALREAGVVLVGRLARHKERDASAQGLGAPRKPVDGCMHASPIRRRRPCGKRSDRTSRHCLFTASAHGLPHETDGWIDACMHPPRSLFDSLVRTKKEDSFAYCLTVIAGQQIPQWRF